MSGLLPCQSDHAKHRCCVVFIPPRARIAQAGVLGGLGVCGECARLAQAPSLSEGGSQPHALELSSLHP